MIDLDAIRQRLDAATPGPWFTDGMGSVGAKPFRGVHRFVQRHIAKTYHKRFPEDARLIAHAPTDIDDLLREVSRLTRALEKIASPRCGHFIASDGYPSWDAGAPKKIACKTLGLNYPPEES